MPIKTEWYGMFSDFMFFYFNLELPSVIFSLQLRNKDRSKYNLSSEQLAAGLQLGHGRAQGDQIFEFIRDKTFSGNISNQGIVLLPSKTVIACCDKFWNDTPKPSLQQSLFFGGGPGVEPGCLAWAIASPPKVGSTVAAAEDWAVLPDLISTADATAQLESLKAAQEAQGPEPRRGNGRGTGSDPGAAQVVDGADA